MLISVPELSGKLRSVYSIPVFVGGSSSFLQEENAMSRMLKSIRALFMV
jgi:hypothetical protein